jgi:Calcineurin-like phosphoesterase
MRRRSVEFTFMALTLICSTTTVFFLTTDLVVPPQHAAAALSDFNFGTAGDWGSTSNSKATADNMNSHNPEIILGLGDYSYSSDSSATQNTWWNSLLASIHDNHMSGAEGNHDTSLQSLYNSFFEHPVSGGHWYYSFNFQNVHFVAINPNESYGVGSAQYNFVKSDLAAAHSDSRIEWIIVFFHQPFITTGGSHAPLTALRDAYMPIFDANGVDLVLQAHNHFYNRSFPIKYNSASPSSPTVTSTSTSSYNDPSGAVYAVVGTGGQSHYTLGSRPSYMVTQFNDVYGYLDVSITNDGNTLTAKFYPNGGGSARDTFTINKSGSTSDTTPPNTKIDSAIDGNNDGLSNADVTQSSSITFKFSSPDSDVASFKCSIDGSSWTACTSPKSYSSLSSGQQHTFGVIAIDKAGNADQSPATFSWIIDQTPPNTTITSAIDGKGKAVSDGGKTTSSQITFRFTGSDNVAVKGFECSLDGNAFSACTSAKMYSSLSHNQHSFKVRAIDTAGNEDSTTPASYSWKVV